MKEAGSMAKKFDDEKLFQKSQEEGLGSLTNLQLEQLSSSGRVDPVTVKSILDTRLKVERISKAKRPVGRPSLRSQQQQSSEEWVAAQEARIMSLSDEEAQNELATMMSPVQNDLLLLHKLRRIISDGGKAGADAARLIVEMQKRYIAPIKRTVHVKIQTSG